jgi:hypothetical protein
MVSLSLSLSHQPPHRSINSRPPRRKTTPPRSEMKWNEVKRFRLTFGHFLLWFLAPNEPARFWAGVLHLPQSSLVAEIRANDLGRATSHTRLRARDHYSSSTLIGGKGRAGPSSLHATLGGRDQRSMWVQDGWWSLRGFLHGINRIVFHGYLDCFQKPSGDNGIPNVHNCWFILFYHTWGPAWLEIHQNSIWLRSRSHMTSCYIWGSMTTLHGFWVTWDDLWTLSFGFSQCHGHGSWLVCGVALSLTCNRSSLSLASAEIFGYNWSKS